MQVQDLFHTHTLVMSGEGYGDPECFNKPAYLQRPSITPTKGIDWYRCSYS